MKAHLLVISTLLLSSNVFAEKTLQECIDNDNDIERLACYDNLFRHAKGNITTSSNQQKFGSESLKKADQEPSQIESQVVGTIKNLSKGDKIKLINGQTWVVTDTKVLRHEAKNPNVTITKGVFSSYKLKFEDVNRQIRVKRIK